MRWMKQHKMTTQILSVKEQRRRSAEIEYQQQERIFDQCRDEHEQAKRAWSQMRDTFTDQQNQIMNTLYGKRVRLFEIDHVQNDLKDLQARMKMLTQQQERALAAKKEAESALEIAFQHKMNTLRKEEKFKDLEQKSKQKMLKEKILTEERMVDEEWIPSNKRLG